MGTESAKMKSKRKWLIKSVFICLVVLLVLFIWNITDISSRLDITTFMHFTEAEQRDIRNAMGIGLSDNVEIIRVNYFAKSSEPSMSMVARWSIDSLGEMIDMSLASESNYDWSMPSMKDEYGDIMALPVAEYSFPNRIYVAISDSVDGYVWLSFSDRQPKVSRILAKKAVGFRAWFY
jgi:hypothetical protein